MIIHLLAGNDNIQQLLVSKLARYGGWWTFNATIIATISMLDWDNQSTFEWPLMCHHFTYMSYCVSTLLKLKNFSLDAKQ